MAECPKQKHDEVILAIKDLQDNKEDKGACMKKPSKVAVIFICSAIIIPCVVTVAGAIISQRENSLVYTKLEDSNKQEKRLCIVENKFDDLIKRIDKQDQQLEKKDAIINKKLDRLLRRDNRDK